MMFSVIRRNEFPDWPDSNAALEYDWDMDGTNIEWRKCVTHAVKVLVSSYELTVIDEPEFEPGEDFVDIKYKIGTSEIIFSNDALLSMIWIVCDDTELLRNIEKVLGEAEAWRK